MIVTFAIKNGFISYTILQVFLPNTLWVLQIQCCASTY